MPTTESSQPAIQVDAPFDRVFRARRESHVMWQKLHGKKCRVLAMASTQHAYWVEFEDGARKIVPRRSLKKVR